MKKQNKLRSLSQILFTNLNESKAYRICGTPFIRCRIYPWLLRIAIIYNEENVLKEEFFSMLGILFYAYGAPESIDDVPAYFEHIIGRTPPEPMMKGIVQQFKDLQTADPITVYTPRIAEALETILNHDANEQVKVYTAYKHTAPFTDDAIAQAREDGCTRLATVTVNPIYSASGGGSFHEEVAQKVTDLPVSALKNYYAADSIVAVYARRVKQAVAFLPRDAKKKVFYTVHSQIVDPERNTPYVTAFQKFAKLVSEKAGVTDYEAVYRSGRKGWLDPDVKEAIRRDTETGYDGFVTCELLSIVPDMESYFEIGRDCKAVCESLNVSFVQSEFIGDSFDGVVALANEIKTLNYAKI